MLNTHCLCKQSTNWLFNPTSPFRRVVWRSLAEARQTQLAVFCSNFCLQADSAGHLRARFGFRPWRHLQFIFGHNVIRLNYVAATRAPAHNLLAFMLSPFFKLNQTHTQCAYFGIYLSLIHNGQWKADDQIPNLSPFFVFAISSDQLLSSFHFPARNCHQRL